MSSAELLPCQCGCETSPQHMALEMCQDFKSPRYNKKQSRIWCPGCGLTMIKDGPAAAIAAWNCRPQPSPSSADKISDAEVKAFHKAMMSELFLRCQPDNGDVFAFMDDRKDVVRISLEAAAATRRAQSAVVGDGEQAPATVVSDEMVERFRKVFVATVRDQDKEWTDDSDEGENLLTSPSGDWFAIDMPIRAALVASITEEGA